LTDVIRIGLIHSTIVGGRDISALRIINMWKFFERDESFPVVFVCLSWKYKESFTFTNRYAGTIIQPDIPIDIRVIDIQTDRKEVFSGILELVPVSGPIEQIDRIEFIRGFIPYPAHGEGVVAYPLKPGDDGPPMRETECFFGDFTAFYRDPFCPDFHFAPLAVEHV
jgi:hypothetical protein